MGLSSCPNQKGEYVVVSIIGPKNGSPTATNVVVVVVPVLVGVVVFIRFSNP